MKRSFFTLLLVGLVGMSLAQAPFSIVRPVDGSKVREKVRVLIPKNSVPQGGYIGIFLGDRFVEAAKPIPKGNYYEYVLDTKGRGIPDGKLKLEVALYVDYSDGARIIDRSSVDVIVANKANIKIPDSGLKLRYRYAPGASYNYSVQQRIIDSTISEAQSKLGGRASENNVKLEKIRMQYQVQNTYGDGDGLLRIRALPAKGKTYAFLTTPLDPQGRIYRDYEMAPIYMRLTNTGMEEFGAVPAYIPMEGTAGEASRSDLFAVFPLPTLPAKPVRPGSVWQSRFQNGSINLASIYETDSLVSSQPARGELLGFEWEMGHPCAKIRHSVTITPKKIKDLAGQGENSSIPDRIEMQEILWFALDKKMVMRVVQTMTFDVKAQVQPYVQPGGQNPGRPGVPGRPGFPGGPGRPGGFPPGTNPDDLTDEERELYEQQQQQRQPNNPAPQRTAAPPSTQLRRLTLERTFILER